MQERGFPRIVEFLSLDPGCHIKLMWYIPGSQHPRAISRVCGPAGGTFGWRHWTVWGIPRRSHTSWRREDSSEKRSEWARQPKRSSNKLKDEGKGPKEKKEMNPIDSRWSQLVDRTIDILLWGAHPRSYIHICSTRLVKSLLPRRREPRHLGPQETNKPPPPPYMNLCKENNKKNNLVTGSGN